MQTITTFFEAKAAYFSEGNFDRVSSTSVYPTTVNLAGKVLPILTKDAMIRVLEEYRSTLLVWGYAHSEVEILWSVSNAAEAATVGIKWRNFNTVGDVISEADVVCHCKAMDDQWRVITSDFSGTPVFGLHHLA